MAPRTNYSSLPDGLQLLGLWDQSLQDMGLLGVIPCTATGTNALTLTPIAGSFPPNLINPPRSNQMFSFVAPATSTGSVTVEIVGANSAFLNLYRMDAATQAASGDIQQNVTYVVSFGSALNGAAGGYQILAPINNEINPIISGATISGSTITTSTYNGNTWTAGTGTLTIAASKTLTADNSLEFAGTDATVMTFPSTSATMARTDAGQTFTGTNAFGTLTATLVNKLTLTTPATGATLTLIDGTTVTGPASSGTVMTLGNVETVTGAKTFNDTKLILAGSSSGTTVLKASATASGTITIPAATDTLVGLGTTDTFTGAKTFGAAGNVGKLIVAGNTSGATILNASATASGTLTLPAATDTLVGKATTDTLTNKTFDSAGTGNSLSISGVAVSRGQFPGESSTGNATAGNIGEYVESILVSGSATSMSTGVSKNITSLTLTAGDWDVSGIIYFVPAGTTSFSNCSTSASTTTAAIDLSAGRFSQHTMTAVVNGGLNHSIPLPPTRFSVAGSTTVFLVGTAAFTVSTLTAWGILRARRIR